MRRVLIHFTDGQAEALRQIAHERRTTVSAVVRQAIEHFYDLPEEHVQMGRPAFVALGEQVIEEKRALLERLEKD